MTDITVGQVYLCVGGVYKGRKAKVVSKARPRHWWIETLETGRRNTTSAKTLSDKKLWELIETE